MVRLYPIDDAFVVGNVPDTNRNYGRSDKLWIASDTCYNRFSITGRTHETAWTYLKFKLPETIRPEWIKEVKLHLYIKDARFVGSTVEVTEFAIRVFSTTPNWEENSITWNNKPDGEYITRTVLKSCEELGNLCGKTGRCQVGGSFELGHVTISLPFWRVIDGYISLILQPDADNNAMWAYSKDADVEDELKPYLDISYEEIETTPEQPEQPEQPSEVTPPVSEKVDVSFTKLRGVRVINIKVGEVVKELKSRGDRFILQYPTDAVVEIVAYAKPSLLGFRMKLRVKKDEELYIGFPWKVKIENATTAR